MTTGASLLALNGVGKYFVGVQALDGVDFELRSGEVHALLGENGAGKSTLVKVMTGAHPPDRGTICLEGREIEPSSPAQAQACGISAVFQEVNLLPNLSVAHNLFLGREPLRFGCIDWARIHDRSRRLLARFGLELDVGRSLGSYSIAVQQLVAIARGIDCSAKVLVLDEPTASLDSNEVTTLFAIIDELRRAGLGVVFVTHFLDQVYAISDRITVLRNGRRVGTWPAADLPRAELVAHMLGRELQSLEEDVAMRSDAGAGPVVLDAHELAAANGLESVSFAARAGETLGLAGLLGSGRTELFEALFGLARVTGGTLRVAGEASASDSPRAAMRLGLALCPEDRRAAGIFGELSVRENIVLALQVRRGWWRRVSRRERERLAAKAIADFAIACPDSGSAAATLSGGNQQKVILARWLSTEPRVLLLDEPTRGIDIGAHAEVIKLIRRLGEGGVTVLVASSEIDELIAFSERVLVMRDLTAVAEIAGTEITEQAVVAAIAGTR